jgi:UBX domain-containing protein 6
VVTFSWDAAVQADIAAAGGTTATLLIPSLQESIRTLS